MNLKKNPLINLLINNNFISNNDLEIYHKGTRDIKEINVLLDTNSGSLILENCVSDLKNYYDENKIYSSDKDETLVNNSLISTIPLEDDVRRVEMFSEIIKAKKILDFGCGKGGFLRKIKEDKISNNIFGLELNKQNRKNINQLGINCYETIDENLNEFDFIFLNHVFEHLEDPITILENLFKILKNDGHLIIEIPHGNDFLIKDSEIVSFKNFTFWSEHICLYTKPLMKKILSHLKIKNYQISFFQRYCMNNHFYWFKEGKPGGHEKHNIFNDSINISYKKNLIDLEKSDTMFIVIGPNYSEISKLIQVSNRK